MFLTLFIRVEGSPLLQARPVYLSLPTDMVAEKISAKRLKIPLSRAPPPNDPSVESFVLDEITKAVDEAEGNIAILVDACVIRHDVQDEVENLVSTTRFPVYSTPMGKTAISEEYDRYGGVCIPFPCPIFFFHFVRQRFT